MWWQLEVIMESGYLLTKGLGRISGVNLRERLVTENPRLDILGK